jgi:DELLA protein
MDELLAVLGYKVKYTEMAHVAGKIEHLEQVMSKNNQQEVGDGVGVGVEVVSNNELAADNTHHNPSDLSNWLESMITELDPIPDFDYSTSFFQDLDDLQLIPGNAVYPQIQHPPPQQVPVPNKRIKTSSSSKFAALSEPPELGNTNWGSLQTELPPRSILVVDVQENGVKLVHALLACAEALNYGRMKLAEALLKSVGLLALPQPGAMRKVAKYFGQGLARRIYGMGLTGGDSEKIEPAKLEMHFYETCPYLKFAHFTANQAILEAFGDRKHVHIIDFGMKQGMQWPALMQALALRSGGPPTLRLTGIGPPSDDNTDHLQQVGWKLAQLAETIHLEFEYRGFVASSLADLDASMINLRDDEVVAVNAVFEMHELLARPNALEKVLNAVKEMKPLIFTMVEQEANHNGPVFIKRFTEALHYYSTLFDSLEDCGKTGAVLSPITDDAREMSGTYLGKQISNVVACEGLERTERHETRDQWRTRLESSGLKSAHLGSNAFKQASMLLALYAGGDGYTVEEQNGCLMLAWHSRQLITTSAWKLG